jgi:protein O-mannosyl-transferase
MVGDPAGPRTEWLACLLLAALTFAALSPLLAASFINFDDPVYVTQNARVQEGLSWSNAKWAFTTLYFGFYYPLTWLSHMADCQFYGLWPGGHHLTSLLLHALCAAVLFLLLNRTTRAPWPSFLVAGLFAVHPLHVESAAWISERKDVLSTLFLFLALLAYVGYVRRPGPCRYALVFLLFLLGLLAKAMLVTAPALMLLLDYWPLRRLQGGTESGGWRAWKGPLLEKVPFVALSAAFTAITLYAQSGVVAVGSFASFPLSVRLMNALISYAVYVGKTFVPVRLAVFYPYYVQDVTLAKALPAALLLLTVTVVGVRLRRSYPFVLAGWLWYLLSLLPVIGIIQAGSQSSADRYTYVASVGLFVMVVWGAAALTAREPWARVAVAGAAGLSIVALSAVAWLQARTWHDSVTVFAHAVRVTERNYLAHTLLGMALQERGDTEGAKAHLKRAIELAPDYVDAWGDLGNLLRSSGKLEEAAACYRHLMELTPKDGRPYNNLGLVLEQEGRLPEAESAFARAVALDSTNASFRINLGRLLAQRGDFGGARTLFEAAQRLDGRSAAPAYYLGVLEERAGRLKESEAAYRRAVALDPEWEAPRQKLAGLLKAQAGPAGAVPVPPAAKETPNTASP